MSTSQYQPAPERKGVALCLSGGGFRAALFHLGALRRLNEAGVLSKVNTISSVSGGSIANGLLAKCWPELAIGQSGIFTNFQQLYEAKLREFCGKDLRTGVLLGKRLNPLNWGKLWSDDHSATDFLVHAYDDGLLRGLKLSHLKTIQQNSGPKFVFCASNLQTGVNFEFQGEGIGDYQIGHAASPDTLVAEAVAASSAFPIAFPPLVLKPNPDAFQGGKLQDAALLKQLRRRLVLSDGGVYDNMGLEPVWKNHAVVLCSDGGKPFAVEEDPGQAIQSRLLRAQDVIGNQALAVRKRWLVSSFETKVYGGAYWGIGTEIAGYPKHGLGYEGEILARIRKVRTDLDQFTNEEQLVLMNHGWALADASLRSYVPPDLLPSVLPPGVTPDAGLLKNAEQATLALANSDKTKWLGRG